MIKPTAFSSKGKNWALARAGGVLACALLLSAPLHAGQDIRIQSGAGRDTILAVEPSTKDPDDSEHGEMRIQSDPGNGSLMQVKPSQIRTEQYPEPIIVVPEVRIKEK
ncbi:MAG: hypothetical protein GXY42_08040 [Desulfovibrionales bacterium]|nr:hypothetical protein [Desulfovibrionales bacterium]